MSGTPKAIKNSEIVAWSQLRQRQISPWEFDMIRLLDQAYLRISSENQSK
jgi:hypothetical protein